MIDFHSHLMVRHEDCGASTQRFSHYWIFRLFIIFHYSYFIIGMFHYLLLE